MGGCGGVRGSSGGPAPEALLWPRPWPRGCSWRRPPGAGRRRCGPRRCRRSTSRPPTASGWSPASAACAGEARAPGLAPSSRRTLENLARGRVGGKKTAARCVHPAGAERSKVEASCFPPLGRPGKRSLPGLCTVVMLLKTLQTGSGFLSRRWRWKWLRAGGAESIANLGGWKTWPRLGFFACKKGTFFEVSFITALSCISVDAEA